MGGDAETSLLGGYGDAETKFMGVRDIASITTSNFVYQTLRRITGVTAAVIGTGLLGQEPSDYEKENKEKLDKASSLAKDWR